MTHEEFMALPITNVQEENFRHDEILIAFTLNDKSYDFYAVVNSDGFYIPDIIQHVEIAKECIFCGNQKIKLFRCSGLEPLKFHLFQRLISSNALRLAWLYRQYVGEKVT